MLNIRVGPFVRATDLLSQLMIASWRENKFTGLAPETVSAIKHNLRELHMEIQKLGLSTTLMSIDRLLDRVNANIPQLSLYNQIVEIRGRLFDEIDTSYLLALNTAEKAMFEPMAPLFGDNVDAKFPLAAEDIAEAGKCLGLGRSTASVFHLMRAMECSVSIYDTWYKEY